MKRAGSFLPKTEEGDFCLFSQYNGEVLATCKVGAFFRNKCRNYLKSNTRVFDSIHDCAWFDPSEHGCLKPH